MNSFCFLTLTVVHEFYSFIENETITGFVSELSAMRIQPVGLVFSGCFESQEQIKFLYVILSYSIT